MKLDVQSVFEEYLVMLARDGDQEALNRLASIWRPRHYAHACRLLRNRDTAADAVQDAWINITKGLKRLREPARFPAWSFSIVTRRCQDQMRRNARDPIQPEDFDPPDETPNTLDQSLDLSRAMRALPPDQRSAIALHYQYGFTTDEISQALCIPKGTVKTRLFHARKALRAHFNKGDIND